MITRRWVDPPSPTSQMRTRLRARTRICCRRSDSDPPATLVSYPILISQAMLTACSSSSSSSRSDREAYRIVTARPRTSQQASAPRRGPSTTPRTTRRRCRCPRHPSSTRACSLRNAPTTNTDASPLLKTRLATASRSSTTVATSRPSRPLPTSDTSDS